VRLRGGAARKMPCRFGAEENCDNKEGAFKLSQRENRVVRLELTDKFIIHLPNTTTHILFFLSVMLYSLAAFNAIEYYIIGMVVQLRFKFDYFCRHIK
jgi:hypothetical protein